MVQDKVDSCDNVETLNENEHVPNYLHGSILHALKSNLIVRDQI